MVRLMAESSRTSFLGLEGLHVFVTGAAGGIGGEAVREFLSKYVPSSNVCGEGEEFTLEINCCSGFRFECWEYS